MGRRQVQFRLAFTSDSKKTGTLNDAASSNGARRLKAIITAAAQFDYPGRPLSTVVARNGLPKQQFDASPASAALCCVSDGNALVALGQIQHSRADRGRTGAMSRLVGPVNDRRPTALREFQTRLIADVVTGKLDVRDAAAELPDPPEDHLANRWDATP